MNLVTEFAPAGFALAASGYGAHNTVCPRPMCVEKLLITVGFPTLLDTAPDGFAGHPRAGLLMRGGGVQAVL